MPNLTLSFDENLLKKGRRYAQKHGKSLNSLIRDLLAKEVEQENTEWIEHCFFLMDKSNANSKGRKFSREEIYER